MAILILFQYFFNIFSHWFVLWKSVGLPHNAYIHCVKRVRIQSYSCPHFPAFRLNTERYGVSLRIQSKCGKIRTRITPNTDTFYAVMCNRVKEWLNIWVPEHWYRSSRSQMFFKIGIFKNLALIAGKHPCWSLSSIKLQAWKTATLLKRDCNADVFPWILRNF